MNIPNRLTLLRIFFVPLLVAALVADEQDFRFAGLVISNIHIALGIFLTAAATDLIDGYLARRWKQVTTVGMLLDPIADKLLISSALISLVQKQVVPGWMAILIIGREFAVSGLRSIAAAKGTTIAASDLGKSKMLAQVIAISLLMLSIPTPALALPALIWLWVVVFFSLVSAWQYFRHFWRSLDEEIKARSRQELLQMERERRLSKRAGTTPVSRSTPAP
jgi:CDP-diacylglycerol--glycerol-3-phosphate 3-phosphatidyltransferase